MRIEEKFGIKKDIPLEQGVKEAAGQSLEIVNAFELLKRESGVGV